MSCWLQAARIRHLQLVKVLKKAGLDDEEAAMKLEAATALFHERCGGNLPKPGQLTNLGDAEQTLASQNDARRKAGTIPALGTAESTMVESPLVCSLLPTSVWRLEGRGGRLFVSMAFFGHLHSGIRLSVQFDDTASGNRGAEDSEKILKSFG